MAKILKNNHKYIQHIILLSCILLVVSFSFLVFRKTVAQAASTIVVNSTSDTVTDDGICTLREAIISSNTDSASGLSVNECAAGSGTDTIEFNIAPFDSSVKTIQPGSQLPAIVGATIINGYTQDDATENTAISPNPLNTILRIQIDGTNAGSSHGFLLDADDIEIRGIVISNFELDGISVNNSNNSIIAGNFIGTDPTGSSAEPNVQRGVAGNGGVGNNVRIGGTLPADRNLISGNGTAAQGSGIGIGVGHDDWIIQGNYIGVAVDGLTPVPNAQLGGAGSPSIDNAYGTLVGGTAVGAANVISGNLGIGMAPYDADDLTVQGNFIGTDYTGTIAVPNQGSGISLSLSDNVQIGGSTVAERNIISGNGSDGICLGGGSFDVRIQGNYIGVASDGTSDLGNTGPGISTGCGGVSDSIIGGDGSGEGNVIAFNGGSGISLPSAIDDGLSIIGNSIFENSGLGIDLDADAVTINDAGDGDTGPNELLNFIDDFEFEEIGSDTELTFSLDVPAGEYRIEFFSNTAADSSGNGEGETFIGSVNVTSAGSGSENFSHTIVGQTGLTNISSTTTEIDELATYGFGSTSEFSNIAGVYVLVNEIDVSKSIVNPQTVALDEDIIYRFTITNNGPDPIDLAMFPGTPPGPTGAIVLDIYPPDLSFVEVSDPNIECVAICEAPANTLGPTTLADHADYKLLNFGFVGPSTFVDSGSTYSFDATFHVEPTSDMVFKNYALSGFTNYDPDVAAFGVAFGSGQDVITVLEGQNTNLAAAEFPLPVVTPSTTTVIEPSQIASGNLPITGSSLLLLVVFALFFAVIGYILFSKNSVISG